MVDGSLPSSLLTNSQRNYIREDGDPPANEYMMRSRIRKRVFAGLRHDGMILDDIDPKLRKEIFREWENLNYESNRNGVKIPKRDAPFSDHFEKSQFGFGIKGLLQFIYMGVEESGVGDFWEILEGAIDQAARERGQQVKEFDHNIEFGDLTTLQETYEMLEAGDLEYDDLTLKEIGALLESDLLAIEDVPMEILKTWVNIQDAMERWQEKLENMDEEEWEARRDESDST